MTGPVKILFVIDEFKSPYAGTEGQLYRLIQHLDRTRFQPHFLVFSRSDYLDEHGFDCEYTVLGHRRLMAAKTWIALWQVARRFRKEGYRIAHIFFNDPSIICPPVFAWAGIRSLISRRDMGYWYTPIIKHLLRQTGRCVSGVLVNSEAVKKVTAQVEKIPRSLIHVIYNGYPSGGPSDSSPCEVTELAELKASGYNLAGIVANIRPIKRIDDLIQAFGRINSLCPKLQIVVIGAGDTTDLIKQAVHLKIADRVHFLGGRADVRDCLQYLDIGVLCSESEGFSNAVIEYLQAGLPVICTDTGGNPEAVVNGHTGFLYDVGDIETLSNHLRYLASDPATMKAMGQKALAEAKARFSIEKMVLAHEAIYFSMNESIRLGKG